MHIHLLGTGAGGGFPQWNCNCSNCRRLRAGQFKGSARTQSSITISHNKSDWVLFNASPDIRAQIESFPPLQPARTIRDTGILAIILCDAQIDHSTGLLSLREHEQPWDVYCTASVHEDLSTGYPVFPILSHFRGVRWHEVSVEETPFTIPGAEGLVFTAVALESEAPPYSPHRHHTVPGDNTGYRVTDKGTGKSVFYAPGLGQVTKNVLHYMEEADILLVDGTMWSNDEMARQGVAGKRACEMGHLEQSGDNGLINILCTLDKTRKILIHINNTNPILDEASPERQCLDRAGVEVAYDGMDIIL